MLLMEMKNQNRRETPLHTCYNPKNEKKNYRQGWGDRVPSRPGGENLRWCSPCGKQPGGSTEFAPDLEARSWACVWER